MTTTANFDHKVASNNVSLYNAFVANNSGAVPSMTNATVPG
jgi:hypothetical protein